VDILEVKIVVRTRTVSFVHEWVRQLGSEGTGKMRTANRATFVVKSRRFKPPRFLPEMADPLIKSKIAIGWGSAIFGGCVATYNEL